MQTIEVQWIAALLEEMPHIVPNCFRMTAEDLGSRDRHGRVEKDLDVPADRSRRYPFLEMCRIEKDEPCQVTRCGRTDDFASEALADEERYASAVVEMGVSQEQDIDCGGIEAEGFAVLFLDLAAALEHSAVDQDSRITHLHKVARPCDLARRAMT